MIAFVSTLSRFLRSIIRGFKDAEFRALLFLVFVILVTGTVFYHTVELWTWLDSLYFSVTTLSTVGYGDIAPKTAAGKIFTIIYLFVGLGTFVGFINLVAQHAMGNNYSARSPSVGASLPRRKS